jgi:hypothetical protein
MLVLRKILIFEIHSWTITMKKIPTLLISITIAGIMSASCSKKIQASNSKIAQLKKDSAEAGKLNKNNSKTKEATAEPSSTVKKTTVVSSRLPPLAIEKKFNKAYPEATSIGWMRVIPTNQLKEIPKRNYKVNFSLYGNDNSIVYNSNGQIMETRVNIYPDQLPPNIHKALVEKFPEAQILSASTLKSEFSIGSYIAQIRLHDKIKEVILTETGEIVEN